MSRILDRPTQLRANVVRAQLLVALFIASPATADWLPNGSPITTDQAINQAPFSATSDAAGGFIVGWGDFAWSTASRITQTGDIAAGWPAAGTPLIPYPYASYFPSALPDGQGGAYFVMNSKWCPAHCAVDGTEVHVTRVRSDGSIPAGWEPDGVSIGTGLGPVRHQDVFGPVGAADARGGVIIAWSGRTQDGPADLRAQRVDSTGALLWGPQGVQIRPPSVGQYLPAVMPDGEGGATVIWRDERGPALYAQHLDASGAAEWDASGVPVTGTLAAGFSRPVAVLDGPHDLLISWFGEMAQQSGIFATRLGLRGERPTRAAQLVLSAESGIDSLRMVANRNQGAILAWRDTRGPEGEAIFAQQLDVNGRPRWRRGGVPVSTAASHKDYLSLASDGHDGAFLAWGDSRTEGEVFATHLDRNGEIVAGWRPDGTSVCAQIAALWAVQLVSGREGDAFVIWTDDRRPLGTRFRLKTTQAMRLLDHEPATSPVSAFVENRLPPTYENSATESASTVLAMRAIQPNPGLRGSRVFLSLPSDSPATLELFDLAGRRLWSREVGMLGVGEHAVTLADGAWIPSGLYFARLVQGPRAASARVMVVH